MFHDETMTASNNYYSEKQNIPINFFTCHFSLDVVDAAVEPTSGDEWHPDLVYVAVCRRGKLFVKI